MMGSPILAGSSDDLLRLILLGKKGPVTRDGVTYNGVMPAWRYDLTDSQIADVVNELYARWQPERGAILPEAVQSIRQSLNGSQPFSDSSPK
jgi:mono/diheme cytochrome c family protein